MNGFGRQLTDIACRSLSSNGKVLIDKDANVFLNEATITGNIVAEQNLSVVGDLAITGTLTATIPASYGSYVIFPDVNNNAFVPTPNALYNNVSLTAVRTFIFNDAALDAAYPDMAVNSCFQFSITNDGPPNIIWGASGTGVESAHIENGYWNNTMINDSGLFGVIKTSASYPMFTIYRIK